LLIFAIEWEICGRPQPGHHSVNDVSTVVFSVKCLMRYLLTLSCVRKHVQKALQTCRPTVGDFKFPLKPKFQSKVLNQSLI